MGWFVRVGKARIPAPAGVAADGPAAAQRPLVPSLPSARHDAGGDLNPVRPPRAQVVQVVEHCPDWARQAAWHMDRVRRALREACVEIHHVGATAVPGMHAAPVVDLVAEIDRLEALAELRLRLSSHGFRAVADRSPQPHRACYEVEDLLTRRREVHLACYAVGHDGVRGAIALCAWLRAHPSQAAEYAALRRRCAEDAPNDLDGYAEAKERWLAEALPLALRYVLARAA